MIKNIKIEDIGINGEGIARNDSKTFFIPNALPSEIVDVEVKKEQGNLCFCRVVDFHNISKDRQVPKCEYFEKCGGCNLQHMTYEMSLKIKKDNLVRTLKKNAGVESKVEEVIASPKIYNYRNKITIAILEKNGETKVGLKEEDSHEIVEISKCEIVNEKLNDLVNLTNSFILENNIKGYNEDTREGVLRHVVGMTVGNQMLITIVATKYEKTIFTQFLSKIKHKFGNLVDFGVYINKNDKKTKNIFSDSFEHLYGLETLQGEFEEVKYQISPYSFMQVNDDIKEKIYSSVTKEIEKEEVVIDAYSGAGLMSALLSKKAKFVYGIEINSSATADANQLMNKNNITNMKNINGDCSVELFKLNDIDTQNLSIILDPPRSGCEKKVIEAILNFSPNKIIYISCSPATLSRDLKLLNDKYEIKKIQPYDMFPWTKHLETVCVLKKIK